MESRIAWRAWALSLALICLALIAISLLTDINTIGATGRFVWNAMMAALLLSARSLDTVLAYVLRRRAWRVAGLFVNIGLGYSGNVILTHRQMKRARGWQGAFRKRMTSIRRAWINLAAPWKVICVALLIATQIMLFPVMSQYVLLIPIGFMIPVVANATRRIYAWMADSIFAATYRRYFGPRHRAAIRRMRAFPLLHAARGAVRLLRMRYLTAWRLWKYDPGYRDPSGELWVSMLEPVRLWRQRKLDVYIGRPLFVGRRAALACRIKQPA
jgi:hypothetical protein